MISKIGGLA